MGSEAIVVDAKGAARGISILWNPRVVSLYEFYATHFSLLADFQILGTCTRGFMTNVYGSPREEQKRKILESLGRLKWSSEGKPWILGGEFNLVRNLDENKGGIRHLNSNSEYFNEFIDNLELVDVRKTNNTFTWNNKRTGDRGITCRLDRFLVFESIMMTGVNIRVIVLTSTGFNHWPVSLEWGNVEVNLRRTFRFEKFQLVQADFLEKLKEWWEAMPTIRGTRMYQFQKKLKLLKSKIKKWNKDSFGNIFQSKQELDRKIKEVQIQGMQSSFSDEIRAQEKLLIQEFSLREKQEEVF